MVVLPLVKLSVKKTVAWDASGTAASSKARDRLFLEEFFMVLRFGLSQGILELRNGVGLYVSLLSGEKRMARGASPPQNGGAGIFNG